MQKSLRKLFYSFFVTLRFSEIRKQLSSFLINNEVIFQEVSLISPHHHLHHSSLISPLQTQTLSSLPRAGPTSQTNASPPSTPPLSRRSSDLCPIVDALDLRGLFARSPMMGSESDAPPPSSTPLDWKFSQVFGERTAGEDVQEGQIVFPFSIAHLMVQILFHCCS
jgi:hypothetical protein